MDLTNILDVLMLRSKAYVVMKTIIIIKYKLLLVFSMVIFSNSIVAQIINEVFEPLDELTSNLNKVEFNREQDTICLMSYGFKNEEISIYINKLKIYEGILPKSIHTRDNIIKFKKQQSNTLKIVDANNKIILKIKLSKTHVYKSILVYKFLNRWEIKYTDNLLVFED